MRTELVHLPRLGPARPEVKLGGIVGIGRRCEVREDAIEVTISEASERDIDSTIAKPGEDLRHGRLVPLAVDVVVAQSPHPHRVLGEIDLDRGDRLPAELARCAQAHVACKHGPVRQVQERPCPEHRAVVEHRMLESVEALRADRARVLGPFAQARELRLDRGSDSQRPS